MDKRDLEQLLSDVAGGAVTPAVALTRIQTAPTADLGFAQLDLSRGVRQGAGEVVYGAGKTAEQIAAIIEALRDAGQERILVTRLDAERQPAPRSSSATASTWDMSRTRSSPSWAASPPLLATDASSSPAPARATCPSPRKPR